MVPEVIPSRQDPEEGERVNGHGHGPSDKAIGGGASLGSASASVAAGAAGRR